MFNEAQQTIIEALVPTMRKEGYTYYVAYTYTNTSSWSDDSNQPDLYLVFSREEITASSAYRFSVPAGSVRYICRSDNYSRYDDSVNSPRIASESFSGWLSINVYEHVYTNASFTGSTLQPDVLKGERTQGEYF
ncbi:MAG TPA: hypothetical protein IAC53_02240, partial [Candidatus Fimenecus excrementigallinarum]|nr:hypothetical protein [Candidatus Fimenecus excrementigallinarum]